MNIKKISKIIVFGLIIVAYGSPLHAAKTVSSEMYLKTLEKSAIPLSKNLDDLKAFLKTSINQKSFVSTDFFGQEPSLYFDERSDEITNVFPYREIIGSLDEHPNMIRNINGIIFTPSYKLEEAWSSKNLQISFKQKHKYNGSIYKKGIIKYFKSNGIPNNKLEDAFKDFKFKMSLSEDILIQLISSKLDKMNNKRKFISTYTFSEMVRDYEKNKENIDNYSATDIHNKIFSKEELSANNVPEYITSSYAIYKKREADRHQDAMSKITYHQRSYFRITSEFNHFIIAEGMSKTQKYNQLKKLKLMLNKKIVEGKVIAINTKKYTIYEDNVKENINKGRIAINFDTGKGYWQIPFNDIKNKIKIDKYFLEIKQNKNTIIKVLENHLEIVKEEIIKKYKNVQDIRTNDF